MLLYLLTGSFLEKLVGNEISVCVRHAAAIQPTIVVSVHLSEDLIRPLLWGGLVLRHLHH